MAKIVHRQMSPLGSYPNKSPPPGQQLGCKSPRWGQIFGGMAMDEIDTCINGSSTVSYGDLFLHSDEQPSSTWKMTTEIKLDIT